MRIVQANKAYLPHIGGIETVVRHIAEGLSTRQHESAVIACSDDKKTHRMNSNGVEVTYAATLTRLSSLPISPTYGRHLMQQTADVLLVHEPFLLGGLTYLSNRPLARRHFKRLIVWWHSDIIRQKTLKPFYEPLLNKLLDTADAIIVATPKHISSSQYLPQYAAKCHVVPYGIEQERFTETPELQECTRQMLARFTKPIILFSGRLVYYKGVEYLIRAMAKVPDAHLVIVGNGPLANALQELAAVSSPDITFIPYLDDNELNAMYKACAMLVLPSVENSEAFGLVQIEAMANGKPVISTDLETGVTYVNRHQETGLVVPRRDSDALACAINLLLSRPDLCVSLGTFAQARVLKEFTVESMLDQLERLFGEMLA